MTTIEELRTLAPKLEWSTCPTTGAVECLVDGMAIRDPFLSECGRFTATPDYYGIPMKAALVMASHNALCPEAWEAA